MEKISRRNFLQNLILTTGALALCPSQVFPQSVLASKDADRPFEMLALGDSVMWGQGLKDKNKFSFIIKNWLETEVFKERKYVNLFVMAHSGASIEKKTDKSKKMKDKSKNLDPAITYNGEINLYNPSIKQQADNAFKWYRNAENGKYFENNKFFPLGFDTETDEDYGKRMPKHLEFYNGKPIMPENVDLILVDGGINDLGVFNFINPSYSLIKIRETAREACYERMKELLEKLILLFPNARIIVNGYHLLLSEKTCPDKAIEAMTNVFGRTMTARIIQRIARNVSITDKFILNKLAERSRTWVVSSNYFLSMAVSQINESFVIKNNLGKLENRVYFARVYPDFIGDENAYGTNLRKDGKPCAFGNEETEKRTFVWEFIDKGRTNDKLYNTRVEKICTEKSIPALTNIDRFICNRAGLFHPNKEGAKAFAEAIKQEIEKIRSSGTWKISG